MRILAGEESCLAFVISSKRSETAGKGAPANEFSQRRELVVNFSGGSMMPFNLCHWARPFLPQAPHRPSWLKLLSIDGRQAHRLTQQSPLRTLVAFAFAARPRPRSTLGHVGTTWFSLIAIDWFMRRGEACE